MLAQNFKTAADLGISEDDYRAAIAGWMESVKGSDLDDGAMSGIWLDIFCPKGWSSQPEKYTVERCAQALRAKLTTGEADWAEALA